MHRKAEQLPYGMEMHPGMPFQEKQRELTPQRMEPISKQREHGIMLTWRVVINRPCVNSTSTTKVISIVRQCSNNIFHSS